LRLFAPRETIQPDEDALPHTATSRVDSSDSRQLRPRMNSIFRPAYVFLRLCPFVISFVRDFKGKLLFGAPIGRSEEQHVARARDLTRVLAGLGPTFIKGPQVLAVREDVLPLAYTNEFKRLQDKVPPFSAKEVERIVLEEFRRPVSEVFEEFDLVPIAAASLGQVHRARFKGRDIAFKVLRPGIRELVMSDLRVLHFILTLFETFTDSYMVRSFRAAYREFLRVMQIEMDYRNEAANASRLRRNFKDDPRIVIPECFDELTTSRTVAFEFCDGCRVDDTAGVVRMGTTSEAILNLLAETYLKMVLDHGFIHADPHPGNLIVLPGGKLAIVDYGMSVEIDALTRAEMLRLVYCAILEDVDGIVEVFYRLRMVEPETNRGLLCEAAETLMRIRLKTDATPRQIQEIAFEILQTFYKFPLRLPDQLVYLARAAALVEGIGYVHDPNFNAIKFATPIVQKLLVGQQIFEQKPAKDRVLEGFRGLQAVARELRRSIRRLDRDELRLRLHQADVAQLESIFSGLVRRLLAGVSAVGLALAGLLVYLNTGNLWWLFGSIIPAGTVLFFAALLPLRGKPGKRIPFL